jgi:hypothetical protein
MPREYDVDFASGVENWVHSSHEVIPKKKKLEQSFLL